jgi:hypothetical protein
MYQGQSDLLFGTEEVLNGFSLSLSNTGIFNDQLDK